jgi:tetratricopeptide (TPR) repeat protein
MNDIYMTMSGRWIGFRILIILIFIAAVFPACTSQTGTVRRNGNHLELADNYYRAKNYRKAKKELLIVLKNNPGDVESNFRLGVVYGNEGLIKKSQAAFTKVISLDPTYSKAYFNLGVLYSKEKSEDSIKNSIKYFDAFLKLEPDAIQKQEINKWKLIQSRKLNELKE